MKENKGLIIPTIAVVIFIAIAVSVVGYAVYSYIKSGDGTPVPFFTGFTSLSLDQAEFQSDHPFFNDETWILTVAQGGLGQYVSGTISKETIGDKSGTDPERDLRIDITHSDQLCEYPIKVNYQTTPIYTYNIHDWTCALPLESDARNNCPQGLYGWGKYSFSFTCFCIEQVKQTGAIAYQTIETPYVRTVADIEVSNGDSIETKTFDTKGQIDGFVGSNVYVIWNGYLVRDVCENEDPYYGFYKDGSWKIGWSTNYEDYKTMRTSKLNDIENCLGIGCGADQYKIAVDKINAAANTALNEFYFGELWNPYNLDQALIKKDLQSPAAIPVWTFYIKADWLGIYQPVADVEIVDVVSNTFKSGSEGEILVSIENPGNEAGNINVWAVCPAPFEYYGATQTISVLPGEVRNVYLKITADVSQPTTDHCTVYASVIGKTDTKTVQVSVDPHQICDPNKYYCDNNQVKLCNSYGSSLDLLENCGSDKECTYDDQGKAYCKEIGEPPPPPPPGPPTGECYTQCDRNAKQCELLDLGCKAYNAIAIPLCKFQCWIIEKALNFLMGIISASMIGYIIFKKQILKGVPFPFNWIIPLILWIVVLVLSFLTPWIGFVIIIIGIFLIYFKQV